MQTVWLSLKRGNNKNENGKSAEIFYFLSKSFKKFLMTKINSFIYVWLSLRVF